MRSLRVGNLVDHGVGGKEATHGGVIDAPVHIDEIKIVDHLVAGKAPGGLRTERPRRIVRAIGIAPLALLALKIEK